jgi:hypothetical protein
MLHLKIEAIETCDEMVDVILVILVILVPLLIKKLLGSIKTSKGERL